MGAQSHGATASTNTQPGGVRLCTCVGATVIYARLLSSDAAGNGRAIEIHSFPCAAFDFPCVDTVSGGTRPRVIQTGPLSTWAARPRRLTCRPPGAQRTRGQALRRLPHAPPFAACRRVGARCPRLFRPLRHAHMGNSAFPHGSPPHPPALVRHPAAHSFTHRLLLISGALWALGHNCEYGL
ncbi:uncharacterized protein SCHCODRAFT_02013517 [Schizophyllum commune H4-8]|uniref:uncharacterized protein n=1 Tax=Schizophyllum commune (strain H4-8 / FGSC 9210) TaxID=578458 RepID=UPI002160B7B8|nr:uncharacterized protein SCHCODRAFT_02013517 [Schizophyllum commune H4-8]KAI5899522.1 hypothetical protein SCHCODRAFT_02013517 [Schizophyllum commune H4-8]